MPKFDTVSYEVDGAVATIALDRQDALNSFDETLRRDLLGAFEAAADDDAVRVAILTGKGRAFSAGADLKAGLSRTISVEETLQNEYRPIMERIIGMEKPVIAAINGSAAGIGLSFALQCDLAIMADNAFLLSPFSTISLVPDGGANWLLARQLGYKRAYQLAVEAERIDAERCLQWGLVNRVVPADDLLAEAQAWAASLAERAPLSLAATKKAMRHAMAGDWASTFDLEAGLQNELVGSDDNTEGVTAFFDKRKPKFTGK